MKYSVGTQFHTFYVKFEVVQMDEPMYGVITAIDDDRYDVSWIYSEKTKRANFHEWFTEGELDDVMRAMRYQDWTIRKPVELPEELFTL